MNDAIDIVSVLEWHAANNALDVGLYREAATEIKELREIIAVMNNIQLYLHQSEWLSLSCLPLLTHTSWHTIPCSCRYTVSCTAPIEDATEPVYCSKCRYGPGVCNCATGPNWQKSQGKDAQHYVCDNSEVEVERLQLLIRRWAAPRGTHKSCNCSLCRELQSEAERPNKRGR